jgi:hypothetical protein
MMVVLNSRMVYGITNNTLSTELNSACQKPTVQDGISVTHEQCTDALDLSVGTLKMVSITYINLDIDVDASSWGG